MSIQLTVPTMACSACGATITQAIQAIAPAAIVQTNPKTKRVTVDTQVAETTIKQAIVNAGYTVV